MAGKGSELAIRQAAVIQLRCGGLGPRLGPATALVLQPHVVLAQSSLIVADTGR